MLVLTLAQCPRRIFYLVEATDPGQAPQASVIRQSYIWRTQGSYRKQHASSNEGAAHRGDMKRLLFSAALLIAITGGWASETDFSPLHRTWEQIRDKLKMVIAVAFDRLSIAQSMERMAIEGKVPTEVPDPQDVRGFCEQLALARSPVVMPSPQALSGIPSDCLAPGTFLGALFGGAPPIVFWDHEKPIASNLVAFPAHLIKALMKLGALSCHALATAIRLGTLAMAWVPLRLVASAHAQAYPAPSGMDASLDESSKFGSILNQYWKWFAFVISRCGIGFLHFARWCAAQEGILPSYLRDKLLNLHELAISDYSWPEADETLRQTLGDDYWNILYIPPHAQLSPLSDGALEQVYAGQLILPRESNPQIGSFQPVAVRVHHRALLRQFYQDMFLLKGLAAIRDAIATVIPPMVVPHQSFTSLVNQFAHNSAVNMKYEDQAVLVHRLGEFFAGGVTDPDAAVIQKPIVIHDSDAEVLPLEVPQILLAHPHVTITTLEKGLPLERLMMIDENGEDRLTDDFIAAGINFSKSALSSALTSGREGLSSLKDRIAKSILKLVLRLTVYNGVYCESLNPRSILLTAAHDRLLTPAEMSPVSLVALDLPRQIRLLSPQAHEKLLIALKSIYSGDTSTLASVLLDRSSPNFTSRSSSTKRATEIDLVKAITYQLSMVRPDVAPIERYLRSIIQASRADGPSLNEEIISALRSIRNAQRLAESISPRVDTSAATLEAVQTASRVFVKPNHHNQVIRTSRNQLGLEQARTTP